MTTTPAELWLVVWGAIAATYIWRFLGTLFSYRINPQGPLFQWITCVSFAMLAGLISRMVFVPVGPLIEVPLWIRITGILIGLVAFFIARRQVLVGVAAGFTVFIGLVSIE
ncbi:MAG: AzlD domain-containing protein [Gammaproteobacteria bacterium]|jgi:branched-subunit amino acid transport protein